MERIDFKQIQWVRGGKCEAPYMRQEFTVKQFQKAEIAICGLGLFQLFINGKRVSDDVLVPAWSDYEDRGRPRLLWPINDTFTHRIYYVRYDITSYLAEGKNAIGIVLGNGMYNQRVKTLEGDLWYNYPKLMFAIAVGSGADTEYITSDQSIKWRQSHIIENNIYIGEVHDFTQKLLDFSLPGFDDTGWERVDLAETPNGEFNEQRCPTDKRIRSLKPVLLQTRSDSKIYDCGENTVGWAKLKYTGPDGGRVKVVYAEELESDGSLSFATTGGEEQIQQDQFINVPAGSICEPEFTWHGYRYFQVYGEAEPEECVIVHTDLPVTSTFSSDSDVLNWLYQATVNTFLCNVHLGVPSDCPHRERLGYTGDGQLFCDTGMLLADSRLLYEKWIQDIADGQDPDTGHVQHTAPFAGGGGGPGGWGCAIVEVPYQYYRHYGDKSILEKYYPNMLKYIDYLELRSENGLVVAEEPGGWCLGDWCTPDPIAIPEPFINTYFYVKSMEQIRYISEVLDKPFPFEKRLEMVKQALIDHYYDPDENSFCGSIQGADVFALDLGLGNQELLEKVAQKYSEAECFDTGIFGTDVLIKVLFENGYAQTAFDLLTSEKYPSFGHIKNQGATTLWEYWDGRKSHNHPMFGACTKYLFYGLLGIKQKPNSTGFKDVIIAPVLVKGLEKVSGAITAAAGKIAVGYGIEDGRVEFTLEIGSDIRAEFRFKDKTFPVKPGVNTFDFELSS